MAKGEEEGQVVEVLADEEVAVAPGEEQQWNSVKNAECQKRIPVKIRISSPQLGRVFLLALDQYFGDWLVDRVSRGRRGE